MKIINYSQNLGEYKLLLLVALTLMTVSIIGNSSNLYIISFQFYVTAIIFKKLSIIEQKIENKGENND